ncbi:hypothetical protein ABFP08_10475 [Mammaliicoccus sciuri]
MKKIKLIKITLLIIILAEEIRSAIRNTRFIPEDSNGYHFKKGRSIKNPNQKYFD